MVRSAKTLAFALLVSLPACRPTQAPIENPHASVGFAPDGRPHSTGTIAAAIRRGLLTKKWNVLTDQPGLIHARVDAGEHYAVVRITYTAGGWLIEHVDTSPTLRYEEHRRHGTIVHRRYNGWVRRLDAAIRDALLSSPPTVLETPASAPAPGWE